MNDKTAEANYYVLFEIAGTTYAVPSQEVQQLEMIEHITPVPNSAEAIEGVVFSRGNVIPALNLRARFGFTKIEHSPRSRLIVVQVDGRHIGLIVDAAREFQYIPAEAITAPPEALSETSGNYLTGIATIAERLILLLDLREAVKIISENETRVEN
jgi:purine-binding chemotaxis protein CheW